MRSASSRAAQKMVTEKQKRGWWRRLKEFSLFCPPSPNLSLSPRQKKAATTLMTTTNQATETRLP